MSDLYIGHDGSTVEQGPLTFLSQNEAIALYEGSCDCQCARCGSSTWWQDCDGCAGEGFTDQEDDEGGAYEEPCDFCQGDGSWPLCLSKAEWCEANPLPGRETVERGAVEWFQIPERDDLGGGL